MTEADPIKIEALAPTAQTVKVGAPVTIDGRAVGKVTQVDEDGGTYSVIIDDWETVAWLGGYSESTLLSISIGRDYKLVD